jgi:hypothetical protein
VATLSCCFVLSLDLLETQLLFGFGCIGVNWEVAVSAEPWNAVGSTVELVVDMEVMDCPLAQLEMIGESAGYLAHFVAVEAAIHPLEC